MSACTKNLCESELSIGWTPGCLFILPLKFLMYFIFYWDYFQQMKLQRAMGQFVVHFLRATVPEHIPGIVIQLNLPRFLKHQSVVEINWRSKDSHIPLQQHAGVPNEEGPEPALLGKQVGLFNIQCSQQVSFWLLLPTGHSLSDSQTQIAKSETFSIILAHLFPFRITEN